MRCISLLRRLLLDWVRLLWLLTIGLLAIA